MANRLSLVPGGAPAFGARYWDFSIDGTPLVRLLRRLEESWPTAGPLDAEHIPVLVHTWPTGMSPAVIVLLGEQPSELPNGRAPLYVCPQCGDLGCGALTAEVARTDDAVTWRDFGWDVADALDEEPVRLAGGPFVFAREQYDAELRRFVETFDAVRASSVLD